MSLGPALDDAIGLVLVYLMLSILVTTINEAISAFLNKRGKDLYAALINLTEGIVYTLPASAPGAPTTAPIADHALIQNNTPGVRLPSYVSSRNFALAVLDGLGGFSPTATMASIQDSIGLISNPAVKQALLVFAKKSGQELAVFQAHIEGWFNDAMDRLSGDYKRWSQAISLAIALCAAVLFNANTFSIVNTLWTDAHVRDAMVTVATKQTAPTLNQTATFKDIQQAGTSVAKLPLPLGWKNFPPFQPSCLTNNDCVNLIPYLKQAPSALIGWLFTAFAVSLGAPFWFDTLQKLVNVRSTGPKPGGKKSASATGSMS